MPQIRPHISFQIRFEHHGTSNEIWVPDPLFTRDIQMYQLQSREFDKDRLFEYAVPPESPRFDFPVIARVKIQMQVTNLTPLH